jgi:hypothetical protein
MLVPGFFFEQVAAAVLLGRPWANISLDECSDIPYA